MNNNIISQLFTEKFRPKNLTQLIAPPRIKTELQRGLVQNLLFHGQPGTGKTSTLFILSEGHTSLYINASEERGIDTIREKISKFCSTISLDEGRESLKCVILDECLEENEKVRIGKVDSWEAIKLKDLEQGKIYNCPSLNLEHGELEEDTCEIIIDREAIVYEVKLTNDKTILVTDNHPFITIKHGKFIQKTIKDGLDVTDRIVTFKYHYTPQFVHVKSITEVGIKRVINLKVHKNHTFFTENGICTHNCDGATEDFYKALRAVMERYSSNARFIASCNYLQKIPEALQSRFQVISFDPLNKDEETYLFNEYIKRINSILKAANIETSPEVIQQFIKNNFPDLRTILNKVQSLYLRGIKQLTTENLHTNYDFEDLFKLCLNGNSKPYENYQVIVNQYGNRVDDSLSMLATEFPEYLKNHYPEQLDKLPMILIAVAEYQYQRTFVIDTMVSLCAAVFKIQQILK